MAASTRSRRRARRTGTRRRLRLPRRIVTWIRVRRWVRLRLPLVEPIGLARRIVRLPCWRARPGGTERVPAVGPLILVRRRPLGRRLARTRLTKPPEAFGAARGCLVAARRLRRPRILSCAVHARLAKPAEPRLILSCARWAAGSSLPGWPAGLRGGLLSEEMHVVARVRNVGRLPVRKQ